MAKAPAVVIVVRHGSRLDAADKNWHLTSPTPYDPPLTYGGWVQSRALGLRIASLLHARERDIENNDSTPPNSSPRPDSGHFSNAHTKVKDAFKKRKHKVVVHSSPFQRCIQTSIGISAGLSQYQGGPSLVRKSSDARRKTASRLHSNSPRLSAVDSQRLESILEPQHGTIDEIEHIPRASSPLSSPFKEQPASLKEQKEQSSLPRQPKATLRVDAFLGEWLSPDYFENITPPPNSTMMVAGAKANLLRKSENIDTYTPTPPRATGMWGTQPSSANKTRSASPSTRRAGGTLRERASSQSSLSSSPAKSFHHFRHQVDDNPKQDTTAYLPPTPTYAVSPVDPIPRGYVSHAKDACVNVDYQWDSMREPQYWGDGGAYGEEWSAMHKRFRRGLNSMIECYSRSATEGQEHVHFDDDDDDDTDTVLVLVTHGAGCNALIGALTNQPVLIDVGMASLTLATLRNDAILSLPTSNVTTPTTEDTDPLDSARPPVRRNSTDLGLATIYDMKIVASSEHLRPGVDPAASISSAPSSPMLASQKMPEYRRRYGSAPHVATNLPAASTWNPDESASAPSASTVAPSGIRRGSVATARPERMRTYSLAAAVQVHSALEEMKMNTTSPTGLWSSPTTEKSPSPGQDFVLDFSNSPESSRPSSRPASRPTSRPSSRPSSGAPSRVLSPNQSGAASPSNTTSGTMTATEHAVATAAAQIQQEEADARAKAEHEAQAEEAAEVQRESESAISNLPAIGSPLPQKLGRTLSQKGLWGSAASGLVNRERGITKRRWTLQPQARD
ncbi:hypothetical protein BDV97DRAFT_421497 [Delphinella strobiligena]|nr:hypothetical protein BDV97DRAFT_421497 [Delphinella strobiligena]